MFQYIYYKILDSDNLVRNDFHPYKNQVCRFCGESFPKVTFNNRPHMIPELLGRNDFVYDIECDICNKKFSYFENNISTFIQPYITLCGIKTKNKIPNIESRKDGLENLTRLKRSEKGVEVDFGKNLDDFNYKKDGESLTINLRKKSYIPYMVFKGIIKIALSVLPESELNNCREIFNWLRNDSEITCFPFLIKTRLNKKMFKEPSVSIYKAKDVHVNGKEYPEYTVLIGTANIVLQFFLPLTKENGNKHVANSRLEFEIFPASILDDKLRYRKDGNVQFEFNFTSYDLRGLNPETEDERISFKGKIPKF